MPDDQPLRTSIADDLGSLATAFAAPTELAPGTRVGDQFVIEAPLGRGGMGVVYRAHDRRLDRRVAIKLGLSGADLARAQREAVALARLAHPNVVTIHQVGEHAGVPYVAMELCEGGTVRAWLRAAPRPWRDILRVFTEAGRGLAAAHAAGLVHRDVKPDNFLLGADGRARVADFGLARDARGLVGGVGGPPAVDTDASTVDERAAASAPPPPPMSPGPSTPLTATGAVVGTPRYMAPEQLDGGALDARTDQFAFAVALYEALAGVDPFPPLPAVRAAATRAGKVAAPARDRQVPRRVLAVVQRGLAADPAARFASMDALLAQLARAARVPRAWLAAAAVAAAGLGVAAWSLLAPTATPPPGCEPPGARLHAVWNDAARAALTARGAAGGELAAVVDARLASWTALRAATCRAIGRGGEAAAGGYVTLRCLDQRLADLGFLLAQVPAAPAALDSVAVRADNLPATDGCRDGRQFTLVEPQPDAPQLRTRVAADRAALHNATASGNVGRFAEALAQLDQITAVGDYPPLAAETQYARADILGQRGDLAASKAAYRQAIASAAAANHTFVQVSALLDLAHSLADDERGDPRQRAEIDGLLALADGVLRGAGGEPVLEAHVRGNRAAVRNALGDYAGALADAQAALALRVQHDGPRSSAAAIAAVNVGVALLSLGRATEALAVLAPALEIAEAVLAPNHDAVRTLVDLVAGTEQRLGQLEAARAHRERALALTERTLGPDHPALDEQRLDLSALLGAEGKLAEASAALEQLLAALARRGAASSSLAGHAHANLGTTLAIGGKLDAALPHLARALAILEATRGPDHPELIGMLSTIATVHIDRGTPAAAVAPARRALTLALAVLPTTSPQLANPLSTLALALAATAPAEARPLAERAIALAAPPDGNPSVRGDAELALAIALDGLGHDARAVATGERALATLQAAGPTAVYGRARAEAWLRTHR